MPPDHRLLADPVPVALVVETELAVGVAEGIGVDRSAEVELADERLGLIVVEGAARIIGDGDSKALDRALAMRGRVVEQPLAADLHHLGRPGEAFLHPGGELGHSVEPLLGIVRPGHPRPVDEVARRQHRQVDAGIGRVGDELAVVENDVRIWKIVPVDGHK